VLWNGRRTNLLKAFYDFPSAESATRLQSQVLLTLLERYEELSGHLPVAVYERSIRAARDVFLGRQRGVIRPEEFTFLWQLGSFGIRRYETGAWSIYLKCCEEETLERVRRRARPAEDNLW
jgi:deoxyadenosine/deoxycytidine kinase